MCSRFLFSLLLLLFSISILAQEDTLRVLFLGNSYTNVNNLPLLCQEMALASDKYLYVDANTPGGCTYEQHATNSSSLAKIREGNWDYVVLQEQSQIPSIDFHRYNSMYPNARKLNDSIKTYNPCAQTLSFMTWGRRFGGQQCDDQGIHCSPDFVDFSHMQDSLESAYVDISMEMHAGIAPVGIAWKKVIENSSLVLHSGDDSHPNYMGSYLAACVFHATFWKESPVGNLFTGTLDESVASYLQGAADTTVFHSYHDWNLNANQVQAEFSFGILNYVVHFNNLSICPPLSTYYWDFGDGSYSEEGSPMHSYDEDQDYTVTLRTKHCSSMDSISKTISIHNSTGVDLLQEPHIHIFPNPAHDYLTITFPEEIKAISLELIHENGRIIDSFHLTSVQKHRLDLQPLKRGYYLLRVHNKEIVKSFPFLKI